MRTEYDAIVVGARCAGSPTALLLARAGHRVLLVDRARFPSDTVSTLVIHPTGVACLRRWGLLAELVASGCPPIERYSFDFGHAVIAGRPRAWEGGATAYAPRRTVLDQILVQAADRASVEVREGFAVDEVLVEDGTVVGIRGHEGSGRPVVERARVVVGASGANSIVARTMAAREYRRQPVLETAFYTFWSGLPVDGMETVIRGDRGFAAIPTNDDLTLVLVGCPQPQARAFRHDVETGYLAALRAEPGFADRLRGATREDRFHAGGVPNFLRVPYGPGWALVGDAGYTKDPVTAQGISDAFRSAELCATALDQALTGRRPYDDALASYHRTRDEEVLPLYELTTQLARLEPPPPETQQLFAAMAGNQAAMDGFVGVMAGTVPPTEFFAPENVGRILTGARSAVA